MNYRNIFLIGLCFFLSLTSCEKYVDGFEADPNNSSNAPIQAVLNAAFTGLITAHEGEDARLAGMWTRQFTGSDRQYSSFNIYIMNAENFEWDKYYLTVENAEIVIEKAAETSNVLASGIAKVIKAHSMGAVASLWGNVPFTEANRFPDIEDPVFDSQSAVYADLQLLLDAAINDLSGNPSNAAIEGADFYFGGDPTAWIAVANTLKARFYLHVGNYSGAITAASNGVTSAAGDWVIPHLTGAYNQDLNIYNSFGVFDREGYMTANEAVLPALLDASSSTYRGNAKTDESARFGMVYSGTAGSYDLNYSGMWAPTASFPLVSAVENALIIAEAEMKQNNSEAACLAALNAARTLNATQFGTAYDDYVIEDFRDGGMAAVTGKTTAEALLYEVMEEKYCSLIGQIEVYNDLRRTDNLLGIAATTGSAIPERFLVPQVEIDANSSAPSPIPGLFEPTPLNQ